MMKTKRRVSLTALLAILILSLACAFGTMFTTVSADTTVTSVAAKEMGGAGFGGWSQQTFAMDVDANEKDAVWAGPNTDPYNYNKDYIKFYRPTTDGSNSLTALAQPARMYFDDGYVGVAWYGDDAVVIAEGDIVVLSAGLRSYYYTGTYGSYKLDPAGDGEYVALYELNETVAYAYTNSAWVETDVPEIPEVSNVPQAEARKMTGAGFNGWSNQTFLFNADTIDYVSVWADVGSVPYEYNKNYVTFYRPTDDGSGNISDVALPTPIRMFFYNGQIGFAWYDGTTITEGDKIVLEKGLRSYYYTGTYGANGMDPAGDGEYVAIYELNETVTYVYTNSAWARQYNPEKVKAVGWIADQFYGWSKMTLVLDTTVKGKHVLGQGATRYTYKYNAPFIEYTRADGSAAITFTNMWYYGGLFGLNYANNVAPAQGDILTLKAGLTTFHWTGAWQANGVFTDPANDSAADLVPMCELSEDCSFIYTGSAWVMLRDAVSINNLEDISTLKKYESKKIEVTSKPTNAQTGLIYSSSAENVVSVDENGNIMGISNGTAEITVTDAQNSSVKASFSVTVSGEVAFSGIEFDYKNTYGKVILYSGEELTAEILNNYVDAFFSLQEGGRGLSLEITADMIDSTNFDKNTAGVYTVTITSKGVSGNVTVEVFDVVKAEAQAPDFDASWNQVFFAIGTTNYNGTNMIINGNNLAEMYAEKVQYLTGGVQDRPISALMVLSGRKVFVAFADQKNTVFYAGDVFIIKAGFKTYKYTGTMAGVNNLIPQGDGEFIVTGEITADAKFIYDGSKWVAWDDNTHKIPTAIESENISLSVNEMKKVVYTIAPQGAMANVTLTEINNSLLKISGNEIVGLAEGETTLRLSLGTITKDITVTVAAAKAAIELELVNEYDAGYYVLKGETLDISLLSARVVYEGGITGEPFAITADNATFTLDSSIIGETTVTLTVKYGNDDATLPLQVPVIVYEPKDLKLDNVGQQSWFSNLMFINCASTSTNMTSILATSQLENVLDKIEYKSGNTVVDLKSCWILDANIVLLDINNCVAGDQLRLIPGLTMYKWTGSEYVGGSSNGIAINGTGQCIQEAVLQYEYVYTFSGDAWSLNLEYVDIDVLSENVTVALNRTADIGALRVPENATTGEFTFEVADPAIVRVSSSGIITGLKMGTTTITVTLNGGEAGPKTTTINVEVTDVVTKLELNVTEIYLKKGMDLTAETLKDKGVVATWIWSSGKEEEASLDGVRIRGFTVDENGTFEVTLTLRQGTSAYNAKLTVIVNKKGAAAGCGSQIQGTVIGLGISVNLIAAAIIIGARKKEI